MSDDDDDPKRLHLRLRHQYRRDSHGCWVWTLAEFTLASRKQTGILGFTAAVLGIVLDFAFVVDRAQLERYKDQEAREHRDQLAELKQQFTDFVKEQLSGIGAELIIETDDGKKDRVH